MSAELPVGWVWAQFSDVARIAADLVDPLRWPHLPHIAPDNIERDTGRLLPYRTVREDGVTSAKHRFHRGQLLYSKIRPYLNKCVQADFEGLCSADMYPVDAFISPRFLQHFMLTRQFVSAVSKAAGSRTILPKTNQAQMAALPVPIAPLPEQDRVVEAVDSALTRLDNAVASLERAQAKLKAYRASVLKAAVEGRLVPTEASRARAENRAYEPAEELLARILKERRHRWEEAELAKLKAAGKTPKVDKWKAKYQEPATPDPSALPELPEGWCWATVGQLAWAVKDGPHYSPSYSEEGIPFITGGQVRPWGVDFDAAKRISPTVHRELSGRVLPEVGDLLYTKGGTTGIARVNTYEQEFSVWVHVAVLKLAGSVNPFYLQHALNSPWCYAQAQRFTHGVGNQDLGLTRMVKIALPLPPIDEQYRIVEEVERLESIARESADLVDRQLLRAKRLRQAALKWAFEGKLADQDPRDEPAEKLLARIRAERAAAPQPRKNGGRRAKGAA